MPSYEFADRKYQQQKKWCDTKKRKRSQKAATFSFYIRAACGNNEHRSKKKITKNTKINMSVNCVQSQEITTQ